VTHIQNANLSRINISFRMERSHHDWQLFKISSFHYSMTQSRVWGETIVRYISWEITLTKNSGWFSILEFVRGPINRWICERQHVTILRNVI
jgi:hypothetical protein